MATSKSKSNFATYYHIMPSAVNVPSSVATVVASVTVPRGIYMVSRFAAVATNTNGIRHLSRSTDQTSRNNGIAVNPVAGSRTYMFFTTIEYCNNTENTLTNVLYQNSGSALETYGGMDAVKISDIN